MNWDAIGAIAELLGAVGVIASLIYLAMQLKQNTRAMFRQEVTQAFQSPVATHGLSKTIRTGLTDFERLDEDEAFEFGYWAVGTRQHRKA
jgi:hypothetical protein